MHFCYVNCLEYTTYNFADGFHVLLAERLEADRDSTFHGSRHLLGGASVQIPGQPPIGIVMSKYHPDVLGAIQSCTVCLGAEIKEFLSTQLDRGHFKLSPLIMPIVWN